ncbi:MAG TPA: DegT/DnrJ/EryC1/StrS family aminotransferase, partial [Methylomirabilota bacterium]|nr:DegT/DnrJ/EryC1/StrS family aminotransferase [Methylomirabilota bacterium]
YDVCYLDIEKESLHFSVDTVKKHLQNDPNLKILIIQNTLGYPCNIEKIAAYCKEKNIILIEDLAHSIGTIYENGKESGTIGDFTVLSFSQDKVVDGISGGALIIRNKKFSVQYLSFLQVNNNRQLIDRFYPLWTFIIRKTYTSGFGKTLHAILKKFKFLSNPMHSEDAIHVLAAWYCKIIFNEFQNLEKNFLHRRKISQRYNDTLKKITTKKILKSINLRFPIFIDERKELILYLKNHAIFVSDIWYDSVIAPKKYFYLTDYQNQCPNAEKIVTQIINLPTHKNVSENDAKYIAETINQWIKSQ